MSRRVRLCQAAAQIGLLSVVATSWPLFGQTPQPPTAPPSNSQPTADPQSIDSVQNPCIEPAPLLTIDDYDGPFKKTAAYISRKLERKTAHRPHRRPGAILCSLDPGEKFRLFVDETFEPVTFATVGFRSGVAQAFNEDASFGQGADGYGKRYGAALADQVSAKFFSDFLYPSLFGEDPRYYRLAHGSSRKRLLHALGHTFVGHRDSGQRMFNFSEWVGTASWRSLSNLYHPGNRRGFQPTADGVAFSIGIDMGVDVMREFLPDISRKFKIPFIRPQTEPGKQDARSVSN